MPVHFEPVHQLEALADDNGMPSRLWRSTGDDPGFHIRLPVIRHRYLVIRLHGSDQSLSPQIFYNFGDGWHEKDSILVPDARDLCLVVDVGHFGLLRTLRLDPTRTPATFALEIEAVATRAEATAKATKWSNTFPDGRIDWLDPVSLFWRLRKRLFARFEGRKLTDHLAEIYALAQVEYGSAAVVLEQGTWLSIVVPTFNTPVRYLNDLIKSYTGQGEDRVELIFSDDASSDTRTIAWLKAVEGTPGVRVLFNAENGGIAEATNAGLKIASGEWVSFLDHDDIIAPCALKVIRHSLADEPQAQFLYTDEVVVDRNLRPRSLMAKPAYDPILLTGMNYINHFSVYRRSRLQAHGWISSGFQGSQDYDTVLRYLDGLRDEEVIHLPYPAYWWRRDGKSFSARHLGVATNSARKALSEHFARRDIQVSLVGAVTPSLHRVSFVASEPKVSVIIPSRNSNVLIRTVLKGLLDETSYGNKEVIIVDNGSDDPRVLEFYRSLASKRSDVIIDQFQGDFNFAHSVNRGLRRASGEHFLLLNNDVSVIHPDWLTEMVSCLNFDRAGIVGAKLLYPNATLQHAGVVAGFGGLAGHWYLGKPADFGGPMNRLHVRSSMTCVTGAAMLISGQCRQAVGEMDEGHFPVAYNDVDYCLRAHKQGFRVVWTPFASLYHHESASRGTDATVKNRLRFEREKSHLRKLHATETFLDPAASPHFARNSSDPPLGRLQILPRPRRWHDASAS